MTASFRYLPNEAMLSKFSRDAFSFLVEVSSSFVLTNPTTRGGYPFGLASEATLHKVGFALKNRESTDRALPVIVIS